MIITSVCRLCMSEKELRCVFDEGFNSGSDTSDMKTIIFITTGVEILQNDVISQKICSNCFKLTGKMFEFRERAVKTDKYLKDQCKNIQKIENPDNVIIVKSVNNENDAIVHEVKPTVIEQAKPTETISTDTSPEFSKKAKKKVHKSIEQIFATHTEIKLPSACLRLDVDPSVSLEMDYVEEYFRRNNQDMKKYVQQALRSNRASKKTLAGKQKKIIKVNTSGIENNRCTIEENKPVTMKSTNQIKVSPTSIKISKILPKYGDEDEDTIIKSFKPSKRRRISDSSTEAELIREPTLMDTLKLKPNEKVFVHRCTICNSPKFSAKELKQHHQTHFKCTYCRKRFNILDRKKAHDQICAVKYCLTRPAYVKLEKLDAKKYLTNRSENIKTGEYGYEDSTKTLYPIKLFEDKKTEESGIQVNAKKSTFNDEIIELSDDDTNPSTSSTAACTSKSTDLPVTFQIPLNNEPPKLIPLNNEPPKLIPLNTTMPLPEQSSCTGTSIVRPSIHIKDNYVLNAIDTSVPDLKVLKQLLSSTTLNNLKLLMENETQTSTPSNNEVRYSNKIAEFKNLMAQLYVHKIPINVKKGDFKVSYEKNKLPKNKKSLAKWKRSKPLDIASTSNTIFNTENLQNYISQGIPLFSKTKKHSSLPTILNHTLPQFVQTNVSPRINSSQPFQNFARMHHPAAAQTSQTQHLQTNKVQAHAVNQQVQTQTSSQTHSLSQRVKTKTSNIQPRSLPQRVQTHTSNIQTHNLPQQVQSSSNTSINLQSIALPQAMPAINVQSHVLPQTYQFGSQQTPTNTNSLNSSTFSFDQSLQNIHQTPVYTGDIQNLTNYFVPANNTVMSAASSQIVYPVISSSSSLNSTITTNNHGSTNTNETTLSRSHIQSNTNSQQNINNVLTNYNSTILNPLLTAAAEASTSSNNQSSTISNLVVNTYESSAGQTPHLTVNPFASTTIFGINTDVNTSTESQGNGNTNNIEINPNVQRPMIRVRNIFELT